jgi:hypothetical protein
MGILSIQMSIYTPFGSSQSALDLRRSGVLVVQQFANDVLLALSKLDEPLFPFTIAFAELYTVVLSARWSQGKHFPKGIVARPTTAL